MYDEVSCPGGLRLQFVRHFVAAWTKVTNLDRFDVVA